MNKKYIQKGINEVNTRLTPMKGREDLVSVTKTTLRFPESWGGKYVTFFESNKAKEGETFVWKEAKKGDFGAKKISKSGLFILTAIRTEAQIEAGVKSHSLIGGFLKKFIKDKGYYNITKDKDYNIIKLGDKFNSK